MVIETSEGVPMPKRVTHRKATYPFATMGVGEMFFVPDRTTNNLSVHASLTGAKLKRKFRTRLCHMRETISGWKPCEPSDSGAVLGVGVWRVE